MKKRSRRDFLKLTGGMAAGSAMGLWRPSSGWAQLVPDNSAPMQAKMAAAAAYNEPAKSIPSREFDVVIAGAGSGGAIAGIAAARQGAKTLVIESKGYPGGLIVEGGITMHSFFNLWQTFNVPKVQLVRGIPQEVIDRLLLIGGTTGHALVTSGYNYDNISTAIDTELYKLTVFRMMREAGATVLVNALLTGAIMEGTTIKGVIIESRSGREAIFAKSFVDCTGYGDLAAYAGAKFTVPTDYEEANSIGLGNLDIETYTKFLTSIQTSAKGIRSGVANKLVRVGGGMSGAFVPPPGFTGRTTAVHDNQLMFVRMNGEVSTSVLDRDGMAKLELTMQEYHYRAGVAFKKMNPSAFVCRSSPTTNIRRGRCITCDYDLTNTEIINGTHFADDVMFYGFHDNAPAYQIAKGGSYGIPYRAMRPAGVTNLLVTGMMITSNHNAHMSTRNTVSCMGQGQAAGTAAALCAAKNCATRDLAYSDLKTALQSGGAYLG